MGLKNNLALKLERRDCCQYNELLLVLQAVTQKHKLSFREVAKSLYACVVCHSQPQPNKW